MGTTTITLRGVKAQEVLPVPDATHDDTETVDLPDMTSFQRDYLRGRAISPEWAHAEGWHRSGKRIGIPVLDTTGAVVNIRLYLPNAKPGGPPKCINTKGMGSPTRLLGMHALGADEPVVVTGGEMDYGAARSAGLIAVCGSNGEGSVPVAADLKLLRGRDIRIALDADGAGRKGAKDWATALSGIASSVRVLALPGEDGYDVNDWFVGGGTAEGLLALEATTELVAAQPPRRDSDELLRMAIERSSESGRDNNGLWLACQLRDERYSKDEAWPVMQRYQAAVAHAKDTPYVEAQARVNLDQAWTREPRKPSGKRDRRLYPHTDLGNAERFVARFGAYCRFLPAVEEWWVWDGHRWVSDHNGQVERWARQTVRLIPEEAALVEGPDAEENDKARKALVRWGRQSESRGRLDNLVRLARTELGMSASPADFDRNPDVLNVANGVLDLRTGSFREHRMEDMLHRMSPVEYDPAARSPEFDRFLARVQPDPEMRAFLQRAAGYSATGYTTENTFLMPYSDGSSGKSTFGGVLMAVFGLDEYAAHLRPEALAATKFEQIPADIARLVGARLVLTGELEEGMRLNESLMKSLTGGEDPITARMLHKNPITFFPQCTIWMPTNHRPVVRGTDEGIWRRHLLVDDWQFIPPAERDRDLAARIKASELPGVLNWIVAGAVEWFRMGLNPPEKVLAATAAYREESDLLGLFLGEECELGSDLTVSKSALYERYVEWCKAGGLHPITKIALGRMLKKHPASSITDTDDDGKPLRQGKAKVHIWVGVTVVDRPHMLRLRTEEEPNVTPISAAQTESRKRAATRRSR